MGEPDAGAAVRGLFGPVGLVLLWLQHLFIYSAATESLYFDKFGHCERQGAFDLTSEEFTLKPVGSAFAHETLICEMTFKAPVDYGICLTFEDFEITDCAMRLKVYNSHTSSGVTWRTLECTDSKPNQMCTTNRYVTVQVSKDRRNYNSGYDFKIHIAKSNSVTEEGVLFASIGVFVGIILGVVALIAILALSVLYCCWKWKKGQKKKNAAQAGDSPDPQEGRTLVEPSAPPVETDDQHWAAHPQTHLYPNLPCDPQPPEHPPPPYVPPPPYEHHEQENPFTTGNRHSVDIEQTYPVKQ